MSVPKLTVKTDVKPVEAKIIPVSDAKLETKTEVKAVPAPVSDKKVNSSDEYVDVPDEMAEFHKFSLMTEPQKRELLFKTITKSQALFVKLRNDLIKSMPMAVFADKYSGECCDMMMNLDMIFSMVFAEH
jgi:hypothetical protein